MTTTAGHAATSTGRVASLVEPLFGGALAFEEGRMGVDQMVAVRRGPRSESGMPAVRR
jgi:cyclopropane-fatty-acyl-phospholipid synthase